MFCLNKKALPLFLVIVLVLSAFSSVWATDALWETDAAWDNVSVDLQNANGAVNDSGYEITPSDAANNTVLKNKTPLVISHDGTAVFISSYYFPSGSVDQDTTIKASVLTPSYTASDIQVSKVVLYDLQGDDPRIPKNAWFTVETTVDFLSDSLTVKCIADAEEAVLASGGIDASLVKLGIETWQQEISNLNTACQIGRTYYTNTEKAVPALTDTDVVYASVFDCKDPHGDVGAEDWRSRAFGPFSYIIDGNGALTASAAASPDGQGMAMKLSSEGSALSAILSSVRRKAANTKGVSIVEASFYIPASSLSGDGLIRLTCLNAAGQNAGLPIYDITPENTSTGKWVTLKAIFDYKTQKISVVKTVDGQTSEEAFPLPEAFGGGIVGTRFYFGGIEAGKAVYADNLKFYHASDANVDNDIISEFKVTGHYTVGAELTAVYQTLPDTLLQDETLSCAWYCVQGGVYQYVGSGDTYQVQAGDSGKNIVPALTSDLRAGRVLLSPAADNQVEFTSRLACDSVPVGALADDATYGDLYVNGSNVTAAGKQEDGNKYINMASASSGDRHFFVQGENAWSKFNSGTLAASVDLRLNQAIQDGSKIVIGLRTQNANGDAYNENLVSVTKHGFELSYSGAVDFAYPTAQWMTLKVYLDIETGKYDLHLLTADGKDHLIVADKQWNGSDIKNIRVSYLADTTANAPMDYDIDNLAVDWVHARFEAPRVDEMTERSGDNITKTIRMSATILNNEEKYQSAYLVGARYSKDQILQDITCVPCTIEQGKTASMLIGVAIGDPTDTYKAFLLKDMDTIEPLAPCGEME